MTDKEKDIIENIDEKKVETPVDNIPKRKKINLDKIVVTEALTDLEKEKAINFALYKDMTEFQITAAQSGYTAFVKPLVYNEILGLINSEISQYEYRAKIYKLVYDKISKFGHGHYTYEEWLRNTSVEDIETFYYGLFSSTFPDEGEFSFECPRCEEVTNYKINHNNLVETSDKKKMLNLIKKINTSSKTKDDVAKLSLLTNGESFELPKSKMIFTVKTPSLYDTLLVLNNIDNKLIMEYRESLDMIMYTDEIRIPKEDKTYIKVDKVTDIFRIISELSPSDAKELEDIVLDKIEENLIQYKIKSVHCSNPKCKQEFKDVEVSLESILFTLIYEKTQSY